MGLVFKKGAKNIYYQFKYKDMAGKLHHKSINTNIPVSHTSQRERAKALAIGLEAQKEFMKKLHNEYSRIQGIDTGIDYSSYTIKEYSEHWLDEIKYEVRDSTFYAYKQELTAHIIPILGKTKLKDVNVNTIRFFFDTEFNECLKKLERNEPNYMQSIRKHLTTLSTMLNRAVEECAIDDNPVQKIKKSLFRKLNKYKVEYEVEPYSWEELMQLKETVIASKVHIEVPVIIAIYTGLRREEILGLRWQDIDFDNRILHIKNTCTKVGTKIVYAEKTKTKLSRRTVPMVDELYDYLLLQQYIQQKNREFFGDGYIDTDLVCVWKDGKPIKPDNLSKRFNRFLKENNLRIIRFHDIRHSFGSVIFNITGDIKVVSDLLGHSNISTTSNIYVKTNEKHKKEAVNYLENGNK